MNYHRIVKLNKKNIFLLDGIGASLSAIFTGLLLPLISDKIGLPSGILYCLAVFPFAYGVYSFLCYRNGAIKAWMLLAIISGNLFYSIVSAAIVICYEGITKVGQGLLIFEILIILAVIGLEIKVYRDDCQ